MLTSYSKFGLFLTLAGIIVSITTGVVKAATTTGKNHGYAPWVGDTFRKTACTGKRQGFGPYDYALRSQHAYELNIVEVRHFTTNIETLSSGNTSKDPYSDIDYTLRAWPNHHRALNSAIQAQLRNKTLQSTEKTPAECYLQRAINFSPTDGITQMLYGLLLHRTGHLEAAYNAYHTAERLNPGNLQVKYNTALLLLDLNRYEEARNYALEVYASDFPLPGLKRKLKEKGYWDETH